MDPENYPQDYNRQAGRTTTTLQNALDVLLSGRDVDYIAATVNVAQRFAQMAKDLLRERCRLHGKDYQFRFAKDKIVSPQGHTLHFMSVTQAERRVGRKTVVIHDHWCYNVLEEKYETLREERDDLRCKVSALGEQLTQAMGLLLGQEDQISALARETLTLVETFKSGPRG